MSVKINQLTYDTCLAATEARSRWMSPAHEYWQRLTGPRACTTPDFPGISDIRVDRAALSWQRAGAIRLTGAPSGAFPDADESSRLRVYDQAQSRPLVLVRVENSLSEYCQMPTLLWTPLTLNISSRHGEQSMAKFVPSQRHRRECRPSSSLRESTFNEKHTHKHAKGRFRSICYRPHTEVPRGIMLVSKIPPPKYCRAINVGIYSECSCQISLLVTDCVVSNDQHITFVRLFTFSFV